MQVAVVFVDIVGSLTGLREQGVDDKPAWAALDDEFVLRLYWRRERRIERDADVDHSPLVFMAE